MPDLKSLSIYVHIPFCRSRCNYCDFNTYAGMDDSIEAYITALEKEIRLGAAALEGDERIHSIYIGGGTPSMLKPLHFRRVLNCIGQNYRLTNDVEISSEANPFLLTAEYLGEIHAEGIERLSMGMQSGIESELALLGRLHRMRDVEQSVRFARRAGFGNINLDLIFGIPTQTLNSFKQSLEMALALEPEHLSIYSLTVEEGTPLESMIAQGDVPAPDEDLSADMYAWVMQALTKEGFEQYEISNWSRHKNLRSRHNLQYWHNGYYLGFGAGAHSHYGERRWANALTIPAYIQRMNEIEEWHKEQPPAAEEVLSLSPSDDIQETMMMGLRLVEEGVAEEDFRQRFDQELGNVYEKEIKQLIQNGLLERAINDGKQVIRLTTRGRMLGNQVFMQFIQCRWIFAR